MSSEHPSSNDGDPADRARRQVAELYQMYSEGLLAFFRAALPMSKLDANDLLQQTFIEALKWLANDPNRSIEHPRGFIYRIAHRVLLRHRDNQRRRPDNPQDTEIELDQRTHDDDVEYLASQGSMNRLALRAMRRLNPEAQALLYLRYWEAMTEREVGEILEKPRSSISGKLRWAIRNLQRHVSQIEQDNHHAQDEQTDTEELQKWMVALMSDVNKLRNDARIGRQRRSERATRTE